MEKVLTTDCTDQHGSNQGRIGHEEAKGIKGSAEIHRAPIGALMVSIALGFLRLFGGHKFRGLAYPSPSVKSVVKRS
jgi:hypothetical protein